MDQPLCSALATSPHGERCEGAGLEGAVDTHVHSAPDVLPRAQDDVTVASAAASAGMRAIVLKNHHTPTADRARLTGAMVPGVQVIGGLVLNTSACGGFNPAAVEVTLALGGRVIWMPTVSARNHQHFLRQGDVPDHISALSSMAEPTGLSPLGRGNRLLPEVTSILDLIAANDAVLATGHLSTAETCAVIDQARARGVQRILVTHPEAPQIDMSPSVEQELAAAGAFFERCYYSVLAGMAAVDMVAAIRKTGVETTVLATDLGQAHHVPPLRGYAEFRKALLDAGLSQDEWRVAAVENGSRLLSLDQAEKSNR